MSRPDRRSALKDPPARQVERDLHDGVQQQLVAIRSLVELFR
jgi:signal transduction histidine kinase